MIKKSVFNRSFELAKMSLKIGLKELQSGSLQSRLEQAKILTQSLTQLKGAAMKAGQLISLEMADYFPPEAAEILAQMQNQATRTPYENIKKILLREWGEEKFNSLNIIEQEPIATASIAQVHKARRDKQLLAVKIQHDGVVQSIDSDLSIIKKISETFCTLTQRDINLDPLFQELKEVLLQETNFLKEAQYLNEYRQKLKTLPEPLGQKFTTPEVVQDLTTNKILTMTWEEGITLTQWFSQNPSAEKKQELAHLILNLYCHEFFVWGLVQTDPNFSNFLIRENMQLVLLDFGSTRHYDATMVQQYVELMRAVEKENEELIIKEAIEFGLLDARESQDSKKLFIEMMLLALEPFKVQGEFDFASSDYAKRSQTVILSFVKSLKYSPPPHRIIFLHRKLGGIFSLLKKMNVKLDISKYWDLMSSQTIKSSL